MSQTTTRSYHALIWAEDVTLVERPGKGAEVFTQRSRETLFLCSHQTGVFEQEIRQALATLISEPLKHP